MRVAMRKAVRGRPPRPFGYYTECALVGGKTGKGYAAGSESRTLSMGTLVPDTLNNHAPARIPCDPNLRSDGCGAPVS